MHIFAKKLNCWDSFVDLHTKKENIMREKEGYGRKISPIESKKFFLQDQKDFSLRSIFCF